MRPMIGIDRDTGLIYEGISNYGHGLSPAPLILPATLIQSQDDWRNIPTTGDPRAARLCFREDFFDPLSRIRRGRLYEDSLHQPMDWEVHKHPSVDEETDRNSISGRFSKRLFSFSSLHIDANSTHGLAGALIVLGASPSTTVWNILLVERSSSNEDVITIRSRHGFGLLPQIALDQIPEAGRERVRRELDKVLDAAHRQSGIAVVDLCRAAATVVLSEWLIGEGNPESTRSQDLGSLVAQLDGSSEVKKFAARLIQRLHSRGKPNEQSRLGTRDVVDEDGVLAIETLAFLLREVGWTK